MEEALLANPGFVPDAHFVLVVPLEDGVVPDVHVATERDRLGVKDQYAWFEHTVIAQTAKVRGREGSGSVAAVALFHLSPQGSNGRSK
jgi:hypothetical protein